MEFYMYFSFSDIVTYGLSHCIKQISPYLQLIDLLIVYLPLTIGPIRV